MNLFPLISIVCGIFSLAGCAGDERQSDSKPAPTPPAPQQTPAPAEKPNELWQVRHKGRTIREWYERARDKAQIKTNREEAIRELTGAGKAGAMALWELLHAADADTVDLNAAFGIVVSKGFVRWKAAEALGGMGAVGLPSAPELAKLMRTDEVTEVRAAAAIALGRLGARDPATVAALKEVLRGKDYFVWQGAVFALGQIRPHDAETIELLNKLANADPNQLAKPAENNLWAAIMNARMEARAALQPR